MIINIMSFSCLLLIFLDLAFSLLFYSHYSIHISIFLCLSLEYPNASPAECSLCFGYTDSTPGYMMDPNNCQKYYICTQDPQRKGGFLPLSMSCPDCMFWDDDKLSCIEVDTSCRVSVPVEDGTPNPTC